MRLGKNQRALLERIERRGGSMTATVLNNGRTVAGSPTPQRDSLEAAGLIVVSKEIMQITDAGRESLRSGN